MAETAAPYAQKVAADGSAMDKSAAITPVYVIGHLNPDTDAIAAAMGYAWLLRERDGLNAIAARAGGLNPQTAWVLKTVGLEPPRLVSDASPRFERIARTLPPILPPRLSIAAMPREMFARVFLLDCRNERRDTESKETASGGPRLL